MSIGKVTFQAAVFRLVCANVFKCLFIQSFRRLGDVWYSTGAYLTYICAYDSVSTQ